jgi:glycogen operon protein
MILAGDEFARTQNGNNNAYAQDNEIGWIDWRVSPEGGELAEFVKKLIMLRQALPMLRRGRFLHGRYDEELGVKDVAWITPAGTEFSDENWRDPAARCFGMLLDGRAQSGGIRRPGTDATMLLVLNAHHDVVNFTLPEAPGGQRWLCVIDTNLPTRDDLGPFEFGSDYMVTGRSFLVFLLQPSDGEASTAAARRAFAHISEAFLEASISRVHFATEQEDVADDEEPSKR